MNSNDSDDDFFSILKTIEKKKDKKSIKVSKEQLTIVTYIRVSTREQAEEGQSLQSQTKMIINYINNHPTFKGKEYNVINFKDEGISGKNLKRKGIQSLLERIETNKDINYLVIVKLDRLTRSIKDLINLNEFFEKNNVSLVSIKDSIDTKTAHGRFFTTILGSLGQLEREQVSERVKDVMINIVEKQPVGGRTPFGYFYLEKADDKSGQYYPYIEKFCLENQIPAITLAEYDEQIYPGDYIPLIFSWYHPYYCNYSQIANRLNEIGIPSPNQVALLLKKYQKSPEKIDDRIIFDDDPKWSHMAVKRILVNTFYVGYRVWNRYTNRTKKIREDKHWIKIKNSHPALISQKDYFRVLRIFPGG